MKTSLKRTAVAAAVAAFALTALLLTADSRSSYASSTTKNLAVLFTNDTLGYLESCG